MTYVQTHSITLAPVVLPVGVTVDVSVATGTGGQQQLAFTASSAVSKATVLGLLQQLVRALTAAAVTEGVTP